MYEGNDCTLTIYGRFSLISLHYLCAAIVEAWPTDVHPGSTVEHSITLFRDTIPGETAPRYLFQDVDYARMNPDLTTTLADLSLSWTWSWTHSPKHPPGIILHDAELNETARFWTIHDQIALLHTESHRDQSAHLWDTWHRQATFIATD